MLEKLSNQWICERHTKDTIKQWVQHLSYFYFVRAWGGHANDGDQFKTSVNISGREDLLQKLKLLDVKIKNILPDEPQPVAGKAYNAEEFNTFKSAINAYEGLEQPGHVTLACVKAFIWVYENNFEISNSGTKDNNPYAVSNEDFNSCHHIETLFDNLDWEKYKDFSIENNICCIFTSKYPEYYE